MQKLRVAVIGTGYYAIKHIKAIQSLKNIELVAVIGSRPDKTKEFSQKFKTRYFDSYESSLKDDGVDVVDIVVPPKKQAEYAILAAKSKKHMVVSKPLAHNMSTAKSIVDACQENGVLLSVVFPRRSEKILQKVKQMVMNQDLGTVI